MTYILTDIIIYFDSVKTLFLQQKKWNSKNLDSICKSLISLIKLDHHLSNDPQFFVLFGLFSSFIINMCVKLQGVVHRKVFENSNFANNFIVPHTHYYVPTSDFFASI